MDFAKQLLQEENVTTQSGVCFLPLPKDGSQDEEGIEQHVNHLVIKAANKAASDLFLSSGSKITSTFHKRLKPGSAPSSAAEEKSEEEMDPNKRQLINCKLYKTQMLPPSSKILPNSLVVIFESFDSLDFVYASPGQVFHNRNGDFHHDDFIGKPFGCKIRSRNKRGLGFVYLLKPTPELWARSLNHRTQIVHELDASVVVFNLNLRPNMVVCESGTGSGAMSHCILRTIAPFGTLHTYEFNGMRAKTAREEFKRNKADHLVTVHWRDVCGKEESLAEEVSRETETTQEEGDEDLTYGSGGFDIGPAAAHAIFLDLPQPELAIPHAAHTLKPNGGLCSYSPCVEQSQRTVQAMKKYGFHSIKTIEVRLRGRIQLINCQCYSYFLQPLILIICL
jgi:tRNA (adenine57-N1/adenine58-N1)-methyltransferase